MLLSIHMMWVFAAILLEGDFSSVTEINAMVQTNASDVLGKISKSLRFS